MSSEKSNEDVIVVFAKSAVPGRVKTRLTPALKEEQAAALYRAFVEDVAATVNEAAASGKARRVLAFAGPEDDEICRVLAGQGFEVMDQGDGDLGRRLERICESVAAGGARRVVIIGTDSPTLHAEHLGLAFDLLGRHDVVWGPSSDGGYYLVGLNVGDGDTAPHRHIFQNIDWSTPRVLSQSWARGKGASLLCELLGFWYDVDTFEDLEMLRFHLLDYLAERQPELAMRTAEFLRGMETAGDFDGT